jgi:hypothetical protein
MFVMVKCCVPLWGADWTLKYYLDELQFQRVQINTLICSAVASDPSYFIQSARRKRLEILQQFQSKNFKVQYALVLQDISSINIIDININFLFPIYAMLS